MNPSAVGVVASTYRQACLAAEKAGLSPRAYPGGNWHYIGEVHKVMGWLPERVIFARPMLGDRANQAEIELAIVYRCMRSRCKPEYIET